jgi:hypothetical protein
MSLTIFDGPGRLTSVCGLPGPGRSPRLAVTSAKVNGAAGTRAT